MSEPTATLTKRQKRPRTPIPTRCSSPNEYEFSSAHFEKHGSIEEEEEEGEFNGNNDNNGRGEEESNNSLPSLIILHKIASYLSVGDAESVGALSRSSNITSNSSLFMPGGHSLDAWCNRLREDGSSDPVIVGGSSSNSDAAQQQPQQLFQQTLSSIVDFEDEEDEGWFVGNVMTRGGGESSSTPHNMSLLSPLEEWEPNDDSWQHHDERQWTPAVEPTCERNDACLEVVPTPALTIVSRESSYGEYSSSSSEDSSSSREQHEHRLRKRALQHKLAQAVFAHPHPLRDYCLDAYATAVKLSRKRTQLPHQQLKQKGANPNPETLRHRPDISPSSKLHYYNEEEVDPELGEHVHAKNVAISNTNNNNNNNSSIVQQSSRRKKQHSKQRKYAKSKILRALIRKLLNSPPISIPLDLCESTADLYIHTLFASTTITTRSVCTVISTLANFSLPLLHSLSSINIFELFLSAHRSVEKTGEKLASGLHSVATGVGSASNAALERLSRQGLALAGAGLSSRGNGGMRGAGGMMKVVAVENPLESKLFRRLHKMDNVSKLVAYSERFGEEAFGKAQKKRAQRMMHYNVSFRPFTATIQPATPKKTKPMKHSVSFDLSAKSPDVANTSSDDNDSLSSESLYSNSGSMFMRTPTSFPPTPTSRLYYFERGSRFTENVIFLARDQLRVQRGLDNSNEQTRAMSKALQEGSRLAVFDASADGVALTCGQHIAQKVGNALYCSTRSMIPVMRNSFVYFEISVSPPPTVETHRNPHPQLDVATLSIGLSTLEMPLNTLVGAWKGSVGLCTTGQFLLAGHWFAPADTEEASYGSNSTVGCLVYLDDNAAQDTRDGAIVMADITFNVNGIVIPPVEKSLGGAISSVDPTTLTSHSDDTPPEEIYDAPTLSLPVPRTQELFPTVTLHSPATCVMCRFNSDDLLATSRAEMGAPEEVTVYAVDGSVILDSSSGSVDVDDWILDSCDDTLVEGELAHDEVAL